MIRDELLVLVAEDEHVVLQGDEVQVLVEHLSGDKESQRAA